VLAVAACTPEGGTPGPTTGSTTTSTGVTPVADAPKVAKPLDTSKWQSKPCSVLTNTQLSTLGVNAKGSDNSNTSVGPGCTWGEPDDATKPILGITFVTGNTDGLSSLYTKHQQGSMPILNRLPDIDGYPAVIYSSDPGAIQSGICFVAVGVTDQLDISTSATISEGPNKQNACNVAMQMAKATMDTMLGGS
jgi:hypothetical protein